MSKSSQKKGKFWAVAIIILALAALSLTGYFLLNGTFTTDSRAGTNNKYDVIVVGAGSGGVSAALEAARGGARVLLVEETDLIGGQLLTVGSMDMASHEDFGGIFQELVSKVSSYYSTRGLSMGTCYWNLTSTCFEPHVVAQMLKQMLSRERSITVMTETSVKAVLKSNNQITGVTLSNNKSYLTNYLIDATEYGDILILAGDDYRIGNSTNTNANANSCIQDITYPVTIKKYPTGVPENLKISSPPPGYAAVVAEFRNIVTKVGVPQRPEPGIEYPVDVKFHNVYRGLPNSTANVNYTAADLDLITKTQVNWANDYPLAIDGGALLSTKYITDKNYRTTHNCNAKLRTIQFIYYAQTELGLTDWSIANDEGFNTAYNASHSCANIPANLKAIENQMPAIPYVRESARGIAVNTLTAKAISRTVNAQAANNINSKSIALGDYGVDLHDCSTNETLELQYETEADKEGSRDPFQIPIDILYSKKIKGLLYAEKNMSQTRLANGATRLQPSTMAMGQAVGALAALAAVNKKAVNEVPVIDVQNRLINNGAVIVRFKDVPKSASYNKYIQKAAALGFIVGYGNLNFKPEQNITRAETATVIANSLNLRSKNVNDGRSFSDAPRNSNNNAIYVLYDNGITTGCVNNASEMKFCPTNDTTLAQLAVFLLKSASISFPDKVKIGNASITDSAKNFMLTNQLSNMCTAADWNTCSVLPIKRSEAVTILVKVKEKYK